MGNKMNILDEPSSGREIKILEGLASLPLSREPWGFSRGLRRSTHWRIDGIAAEDVATVLAHVQACGGMDAKVHGTSVEWASW